MSQCTCGSPFAVSQAIDRQTEQQRDWELAEDAGLTHINQTLYGKEQVAGKERKKTGQPGIFSTLQFCHWNAPEYGMQGESKWTAAFRAAALAIAIANGIAQSEISDKQMDLANGWYQQAKFKWDRFKYFYMPLEKKLLNEVSSVPERKMDCVDAETRAQASVNSAYNNINIYMTQQAKKLRLCLDPSLVSAVSQKQDIALVDMENYNLVDEQWFTDFKNDQRWSRRSNVLNLGRNLNSESLQYGKVANQLYGQIGQQIERAAGGLMNAFGYYGARNDTYMPQTYLNTHTLGENASSVALTQNDDHVFTRDS